MVYTRITFCVLHMIIKCELAKAEVRLFQTYVGQWDISGDMPTAHPCSLRRPRPCGAAFVLQVKVEMELEVQQYEKAKAVREEQLDRLTQICQEQAVRPHPDPTPNPGPDPDLNPST